MSIPQNYRCQCLCPCSEAQLPPASAGDPQILAGRSGPGSYEVTAFSPGSGMHEILCVPSRVELLFPPVLRDSCDQTPLAFKARFSGGLLLPLPDLQAGEPDVGLRTFTPVGELLQYNYFPVCGLPIWWLWDLILLLLSPSYPLVVASSLSLDIGYLFLVGSSVFLVNGCSEVSCYCGVFIRRDELTFFYSAILSPQQLILKSIDIHLLTYTHTHAHTHIDHLGCVLCYFKFHSTLYVIQF